MRARLFLIFVLLPFVDLASLAWLAWQTHWAIAMGAVLVAGIVGAYLIRWAGPRRVRATADRIAQGAATADELLDGVSIFVAGVLFISPGILSDAVALALLFPPVRRFVGGHITRSIRQRIIRSVLAMAPGDGDRELANGAIVDVETWLQEGEEAEGRGRETGRGV